MLEPTNNAPPAPQERIEVIGGDVVHGAVDSGERVRTAGRHEGGWPHRRDVKRGIIVKSRHGLQEKREYGLSLRSRAKARFLAPPSRSHP